MATFEWALDLLSTIVAVAVSVAMLVFGVVLIRRWFLMRRFRPVRGRIVDVRLREHGDDEGEYAVEMTYEYIASGQIVRRRTEDDNRIARLYSLARAERLKRQLERQRKIEVRYDPARPDVAVGGEPRTVSFSTGLGMMAAGSILLVVAAHIQGVVDLTPLFDLLGSYLPSWLTEHDGSPLSPI